MSTSAKILFMRPVGRRLDPATPLSKSLPSNPVHMGAAHQLVADHRRRQAERSAANFEPIFKSLAASTAIMKSLRTGRPAKLVGAQLGVQMGVAQLEAQMGAAHQLVADHRRRQAENGAASVEKLSGILDAAHSCLKNKKIGGLS